MVDCMIIGDSIAVGTGQVRKDCVTHAVGGISTHGWINKFKNIPLNAKVVIISLGSNDIENMRHERENLEYLRNSIVGDRVLWILPYIKPRIQEIIWSIAENYGDDVIVMQTVSGDGVHPTGRGYKEIAKSF